MIKLDVVGRMRVNVLDVIEHDTATEFLDMVRASCDEARIDCKLGEGGGYGPSDHSSFYGAGVPILFLFSGSHADYHKPSDTADKLNAAGMAATAHLVQHLALSLSGPAKPLSYQKVAS